MRLHAVAGNDIRLDGGAMFGNAPRALWEAWAPPDERHRIALATRALLVEDGERLVLLEAGAGAAMAPRLRDRYGIAGPSNALPASLARLGFTDADIDVVVLSHLHFDHAGGLLSDWREGEAPRLLFPRARFLVGRAAWERAVHPHDRDRASFLPELPALLEASGRLALVEGARSPLLGERFRFHPSHGHTPGMLCTWIEGVGGPVVYAADLVPGRAWIRTSVTMGYDRSPERLIDEKKALLASLVESKGRLFFTHDPTCAWARVVLDEAGRYGTAEPCSGVAGVEI